MLYFCKNHYIYKISPNWRLIINNNNNKLKKVEKIYFRGLLRIFSFIDALFFYIDYQDFLGI
jgi:hypothetical protein